MSHSKRRSRHPRRLDNFKTVQCECKDCLRHRQALDEGLANRNRTHDSLQPNYKRNHSEDNKYLFDHLNDETRYGGGDTRELIDSSQSLNVLHCKNCSCCGHPCLKKIKKGKSLKERYSKYREGRQSVGHDRDYANDERAKPHYSTFHEEHVSDVPLDRTRQNSRDYLTNIKCVHTMRPWWEKVVAENQEDARRHKYCPGKTAYHNNRNQSYYPSQDKLPESEEQMYGSPALHRTNRHQFEPQHQRKKFSIRDYYKLYFDNENEERRQHRQSGRISDSSTSTSPDNRNRHRHISKHKSKSEIRRRASPNISRSQPGSRRRHRDPNKNAISSTHLKETLSDQNFHEKRHDDKKNDFDSGSSQWSDREMNVDDVNVNNQNVDTRKFSDAQSKKYRDHTNTRHRNRTEESHKHEKIESKKLSPSRYDYRTKRALFSPKQSRTYELHQKDERPSRRSTANLENLTESVEYSKTAPGLATGQNVHQENKSERVEQLLEQEIQITRTTQGGQRWQSRSESAIDMKTQNDREPTRPMLSKYSQTQAELELDFKLLQRQQPVMESKSSQTEFHRETIQGKDESWEEWISENSKRKATATKESGGSTTTEKKMIEFSNKATQTQTSKDISNDEEFESARDIATPPPRKYSKSSPISRKSTTSEVFPTRKSQSYSEIRRTEQDQEHYRTSLYIEKLELPEHSILEQEQGRPDDSKREEIFREPVRNQRQQTRPHRMPFTLPQGDGLKVVRHSKSLFQTKFQENENFERSIVSPPPGRKDRDGDRNPTVISIHPAPALEAETNESVDDFETTTTTSTSSSSFAMEHCGPSHAHTDAILMKLSEQYDNLIVAEARVKSLDVQESRVVVNESLEVMRKASLTTIIQRNSPIVKDISGTRQRDEFIWRSHSFIHGVGQDQGSKVCEKCEEEIQDGENYLQSKSHGLNWHADCFAGVCASANCGAELNKDNHYFFGNRIYCAYHFAEIANFQKCHSCNEFIFDKTYTSARGFRWHKHHFKCRNCARSIVDEKYVNSRDQIFCLDCHKIMFSKKCKSCCRTITAMQPFVQSGDEFWHARDYCFHCFTCHKSLVDQSRIFNKSGITYCNRYCALMNVSPA